MGRINSREILFKLIFETLFLDVKDTCTYEELMKDANSDLDKEFVKENFELFVENKDKILEVLSNNLKGYTVDKIFKIDLAILLMSMNEYMFYKKTDNKVIINEAVEISKKYSTDKSSKFINGVLANIIKEN